MKYLFGMIVLLLSSAASLLGKPAETGLPFITNFTPKEYNANIQNWAAIQDQRGLMYFGNNRGVLEYDGTNWALITTSNQSIVRSLAIDAQGTIFVGAVGEFGYLAPDSTGKLIYHSLLAHIPAEEQDFTDVWTTLVRGDEVFFQTLNMLFRYKAGKIKSWPLENSYHRSFVVHHEFYLRQHGKGLMRLQNDSLVLIPGGEVFSSESVSAMVPYGKNILIGSRNLGLLLYNTSSRSIAPFDCPASLYLREGLLYHGIALADGNFAFATLNKGIVVMRNDGSIKTLLTMDKGLLHNIVYYLYSDASGVLWACQGSGISKAEILTPITVYDRILGLEGGVLSMKRYKGTLFVSTHQGVYYLNEHNYFVQIKELSVQCWQLELFTPPGDEENQKLLAVGTEGLFEVTEKGAKHLYKGRTFSVFSSVKDPARIFIGLNGSIASIRYQEGQWVEEASIKLVHEEFRSLREDVDGNIWLSTMYAGLYKITKEDWDTFVRLKDDQALRTAAKQYGFESGLPSLNWNFLFEVNHKLIVATQRGVYVYDAAANNFKKYPLIHNFESLADRWIYHLHEDAQGNVWFDSDKGKGLLIKRENGFSLTESQFKRIVVSPENVVAGYVEDEDIFWFGTPDGLFRFDNAYNTDYRRPYATLIRKVILGADSVIFHGAYFKSATTATAHTKLYASLVQPDGLKQQLDYSHNSISFHYAAPGYERETSCLYSYYLEGYDTQWSAWGKETRKEYTNLPEGNYTFKVRARNYYDTISEEAAYTFGITPPWFRTPLAYGAYLFVLLGVVTGISKANARRLKKDNQRLESQIQSRTAEINQQKEKIQGQKNEVERSYKNLTTLSQIGQNITANLELKSIIHTLYSSIDGIMDVASFGVGMYNEQTQSIDFRYAMESGEELPPFSHSLANTDKLAVWCFNHRKKILINDLQQEYSKYIPALTPAIGGKHAASIIYLPLKIKKKIIGVFTVQSYQRNAYQGYHLDILRTLAAYTAIALDNSHAYLELNQSNQELSNTLEHLKQTQMQLVQSEKMASLGQLTAGVAHEINNPINFVSAGIDSLSVNWEELNELLQQYIALGPQQDNTLRLEAIEKLKREVDVTYLLEEIPQLLQSVRSGAQRTTEIVKSLRNFARLDEDSLKIVDLHEGMESTLVILRNKIGDRIQIERAYDLSLEPIQCYPGPLNQVFMNIISNAIQAIEGAGTIRIETRQVGEEARICIQDSGKGMSAEVKQRIFEPFFTTKEVGEGTGLGLSISYSIIEKHRGEINVESSPGLGTTFMIHLPLTAHSDGR